ncbi:LysR substrate-binding domain-containing protein [uncultured Cohaesibacter sp.]|uniref:LysR family transcriptional regulator n=1 Tax=uncultured Cohaesibacter sp. TaxID=1002546 RepID=UPI0029C85024|nr:LysR substrate-binding domain-containing protein [uncultured Cohaesibacter sp.]
MAPLPPLASLLAFEALYHSGSVTGAADRLGRTHSAVSKQLHQLQNHADTTLFEKNGSGIKLTPEGQKFAITVAASLSDIRKGYERLLNSRGQQKVSIKVSSTFARVWAIPIVARFNRHHPDIEIQISLTIAHNSHQIDGSVDLVLSWDRLVSPQEAHPNATTLGDVHIGPVLSPTYQHRLDLERRVLSFKTRIDRRGSEAGWQRWSEVTGLSIDCQTHQTFELAGLAYEAAERGMGVALAPKFLIEKELKSGTLIAPAGFYCFREGLVVRPSSERPHPSHNAQVFLSWLAEHGRLGDDGYLAAGVLDPVWG